MKATVEELNCLVHNTTYDRLSCLNNVKARLYLPVTIFLALLIIIGTIGNTAVCMVYLRRRTRVSSHYFILALAALDLMTCVVGMPTEIADLLLPYTFESPWACKILRFTHSSTIIASSTILIQVAFDRYYRICQLGRQFTANKAKFLCVGAVILGFVCSWPTFVLFGRKTVTRRLGGAILKGTDCSTDDSMQRTIFPTIYYVFLFSLFGITVIFFAILYSKIGLTIIRRKKFTTGSVNSAPSTPKHVKRSENRRSHVPDPPSVDISSGQGDGQGNSTASSGSSSSHYSTSTSSTRVSGLLYGNLRRFCKRWSDLDGEKMWQSAFILSNHGAVCGSESTGAPRCDKCDESVHNSRDNTAPDTDKEVVSHTERKIYSNSQAENFANNDLDFDNGTRSSNLSEIYSSRGENTQFRNTNVISSNSSHNRNYSSGILSCGGKHIKTVSSVRIKTTTKTRVYVSKNRQVRTLEENLPAKLHHLHDHIHESEDEDKPDNANHMGHYHQSQEQTSRRSTQRQIRVGKTTTVLFAVTLAYILSFLPYLTVMVMRSIIKDLEENLSPVGELAYKLCVKSFFINNAINPLIYSFLNQAFRQDAKQMLSRTCGQSRTSNHTARAPHNGEIV